MTPDDSFDHRRAKYWERSQAGKELNASVGSVGNIPQHFGRRSGCHAARAILPHRRHVNVLDGRDHFHTLVIVCEVCHDTGQVLTSFGQQLAKVAEWAMAQHLHDCREVSGADPAQERRCYER